MDFTTMAINGVLLLPLTIGLTEAAGWFGVAGKWSRLTALVVGLVFGILYQFQAGFTPDFNAWLAAIVMGLGLGLSAAGAYDVGNKLAGRTQRRR